MCLEEPIVYRIRFWMLGFDVMGQSFFSTLFTHNAGTGGVWYLKTIINIEFGDFFARVTRQSKNSCPRLVARSLSPFLWTLGLHSPTVQHGFNLVNLETHYLKVYCHVYVIKYVKKRPNEVLRLFCEATAN